MHSQHGSRTKPGMTEGNQKSFLKTLLPRSSRVFRVAKCIERLTLTLLFLLTNTAVAFEKRSRDIANSYEISHLSATNTTAGYTINASGYYYLSDDLIIAPGNGNYSGIYINANDVILDLNFNTVKMTATGTPPAGNIYGIQIAAGKKNITIKDGTIDGIGITTQNIYAGIYALGTTTLPLKYITLENLSFLNCKLYGIYLGFCGEYKLNKIFINETISNTATNFPAGLYLNTCRRGSITNSSFSRSIFQASGQGAAYGLYATDSRLCTLENVSASDSTITSINTAERSSVNGIYLKNCQSFYFSNCEMIGNRHEGINTNSSAGNECCGIHLDATTDCIFNTCRTNNNSGGFNYGSNYTCSTYGFKLTTSSDGNKLINCTTSNNSGAADCAGIFIGQSGNNILESCYSFNNTSSKTNFGSRFAFGITTTFGANNLFKSCKVMGNRITARISNKGYGIALRSELSSVVRLCDINFNGPGSETAAGEAYGIALLGYCNNCLIKSNFINNNIAATRRYGFKDFATNSLSLLTGNIAFGHGTSLTGVSTMSDTGTMNFFVSYSAPAADVRRVFKENFYYLIGDFSTTSDDLNWYNLSIKE